MVMATGKEMPDAPDGTVFHPQELSAAYLETDEEAPWETFLGTYGDRARAVRD